MPDIFTAQKTTIKSISASSHQQAPLAYKTTPHAGKPNYPGIFSAFVPKPQGFTFIHQDKDEKILLFTRRSFFTNLLWIAITAIALILPFFFQFVNVSLLSLPLSYSIILLCFYYVIVGGFAFYNFIDWFYNIGIITEKRLLDIDFLHLSYIDVAITQLPEIEDVVHKQKGFLSSFFDYGDVIAHTVSGREDFVFEKIPHPAQVAEVLSKLIAD